MRILELPHRWMADNAHRVAGVLPAIRVTTFIVEDDQIYMEVGFNELEGGHGKTLVNMIEMCIDRYTLFVYQVDKHREFIMILEAFREENMVFIDTIIEQAKPEGRVVCRPSLYS